MEKFQPGLRFHPGCRCMENKKIIWIRKAKFIKAHNVSYSNYFPFLCPLTDRSVSGHIAITSPCMYVCEFVDHGNIRRGSEHDEGFTGRVRVRNHVIRRSISKGVLSSSRGCFEVHVLFRCVAFCGQRKILYSSHCLSISSQCTLSLIRLWSGAKNTCRFTYQNKTGTLFSQWTLFTTKTACRITYQTKLSNEPSHCAGIKSKPSHCAGIY